MTNNYKGWCSICRKPVWPRTGTCSKSTTGKWIVSHLTCPTTPAETPDTRSRPQAERTNQYAAPCSKCRSTVAARTGLLSKPNGRWIVTHREGDCVTAAPAEPSDEHLPDVPEGHYAVPSATGNNDLDFYRVDRPTEGKYAGRVFVKRVIGGHPDTNVRYAEKLSALQRIAFGTPELAGPRYGQEIGQCARCNRHLTDEDSRTAGYGADCRAILGIALAA
jgi:hypothetical protein